MDNYQKAVKHFKDGKVDSAVSILTNLHKRNRKDFDSLNFLGIIAFQSKNYDSAKDYFQKVVRIYERHPEAHYNLGLCYQLLSDNLTALKHYEKAIRLNPKHFNALMNAGIINFNQSKYEIAEEFYKEAFKLNSTDPNLLSNYGNLLLNSGKYQEAHEYYSQAVKTEPENPLFNFNLGNCLLRLSDFTGAADYFKKAIRYNPGFTDAKINLSSALMNSGNFEEAEDVIVSALNSNPEHIKLNFNLAYLYQLSGKTGLAVEQYSRVVELDPGFSAALINMGNIYERDSEFDKSQKLYDLALKDEKTRALTLTNIGKAKLQQNLLDEAISLLKSAIEIDNEIPEAHFNLGFALLKKGEFSEGWAEYEWRLKQENAAKREFSRPKLEDQSVENKTVFVYDEQGVGDAIQFSRYFELLKKRGAKVIFEASSQSYELIKQVNGIDELIQAGSTEESQLDYDYYSPLLSLPRYFNTDLNSIPWSSTYISAQNSKSEIWKDYFSDELTKIGLVWSGNPNHTNDKNRSCPLSELIKLSELEAVKLFSLQKGAGLEQVKSGYKLDVLDSKINDFTDTAAIIENLDLVISVDTSVAHLAGAMGKEIWLIIPFAGEWRWLTDRDDSPWYPTMKIFRQPEMNDWKSVVDQMAESLGQRNESRAAGNPAEESSVNLPEKLYLALTQGENFGWGVCSNYLRKELSKRMEIENVDQTGDAAIDGKVFHAIADLEFNSLTKVRGSVNYGYTFFENELLEKSVENSKNYDLVVGGSSWCVEKMNEKGIENTDLLIQGVDPEIFFPLEQKKDDNLFVIFSGGKFELRKGQDLVLSAFKILQQKYSDIVLINAWYNSWLNSIGTMKRSKHIKFAAEGNSWEEFMNGIYTANGIDASKIFTLPLTQNTKLRELYAKSDVGLFPNRCEGGTNLVMMEYMACAKPVIASYNTGHKDILTSDNSLMLEKMSPLEIYDEDKLVASWEDPDLDELVDRLEYAYHNSDKLAEIGKRAGDDLKNYTWGHSAEQLIKIISR